MKPPIFRPAAAADVDDAYRWYEAQQAGLREEFLAAVRIVLESMTANPELFPVVHRETRRALVRRFPYGLYSALLKIKLLSWPVCTVAEIHDGGNHGADGYQGKRNIPGVFSRFRQIISWPGFQAADVG